MTSRAMVVLGAGSASRFGGDKLMAPIAGAPVFAHTLRAVEGTVDTVVAVCRSDQREDLEVLSASLGVEVVVGGATRTRSEIAGVAALGAGHDLVGIHDAARPLIGAGLVETLFSEAARHGGAIPVVSPEGVLLDRGSMTPVGDVYAAQTPQVFRFPDLEEALGKAGEEGFDGDDTAEVVARFTGLAISAVPGDPSNLKITYPADLEAVRRRLEGPQGSVFS